MRTTRLERAVAVSITMLGGLALGAVSSSGFLLAQSMEPVIERSRAQLELARKRAIHLTRINDGQVSRKGQVQSVRVFLPTSTTGVAGARLQDRIMKLITSNNGRVQSARVLDTEGTSNLLPVSVEVNFESNIVGLRDILLAAESAAPLLFVDRFSVRQLNTQSLNSAPTAIRHKRPRLAATMRVTSYMSSQSIETNQE